MSFVVVTCGRPQWLERALTSIRQQTVRDAETVVVINGLDAGTEEVVGLDATARIVTLPVNLGVCGGRNAGIAAARGEVLFFVDDDAELTEADVAERVLGRFGKDPSLGIVGLLAVDAGTGQAPPEVLPFRDKRRPAEPTAACYFCGCAFAVRHEVFERVGVFDEALFYSCEEIDLSYRVLESGFSILFDPSAVVTHHRVEAGNLARVMYYEARNRPWLALRHLPLASFLTHCLSWWGRTLLWGIRGGDLKPAWRGIRDGVAAWPAIWRRRRLLSRPARRTLRRHGGRLWY